MIPTSLPPVVVHIGYFRTGTTMHQRHVFPNLERVRFLGKPFADPAAQAALRQLACSDPRDYDADAVRGKLLGAVGQIEKGSIASILVSNELMLSPEALDIGEIIDRLQVVFGPVRILITVREQYALFKSWCGNVLPKAAYGSLKAIIDQHSKFGDPREARISYLDYGKFYALLREKVGDDEILVLPFELMRTDRPKYATLMADFLGISSRDVLEQIETAPRENSSPRPFEMAYIDFKKRFFTRKRLPALDRWAALPFRFSSLGQARMDGLMLAAKKEIRTQCAARNTAFRELLLERIGVDIADLGYSVAVESADSKTSVELTNVS